MAYSEAARERRQCTGRRKDGERCRAWALWDDPRQVCVTHAGRHHRGRMASTDGGPYHRHKATNYQPCTCAAYEWPHRPGGGFCRWPLPPLYRCRVRSGKRNLPRYRGAELRLFYKCRGGIEPGNWRRF